HSARRLLADQGSAHAVRAARLRRRLGELVGFAHVRAVVAALLVAAPAFAHELGIVRVDAEFREDRADGIDVRAHAAIAEAAVVCFDGKPAHFEQTGARLTGRTPSGVSRFTFADGAIAGYSVVKVGNATQWVAPGKTSAPFVLDRAVVPLPRWQIVR